MAMKEDIVVYDDCSVTAVDLLQLEGDVMNEIFQFLTWDVQQLRGDVMGDFADIGMVVTDHLGFLFARILIGPCSPYREERSVLQKILCSLNQNVWCSFMPLNGDLGVCLKASCWNRRLIFVQIDFIQSGHAEFENSIRFF